jgi:hypothetical protein
MSATCHLKQNDGDDDRSNRERNELADRAKTQNGPHECCRGHNGNGHGAKEHFLKLRGGYEHGRKDVSDACE